MTTSGSKAYDEVVDFIAAGMTPRSVAEFQPSVTTKARVADLLYREKTGDLSEEERSELDRYMQMEHLMRLAKERARSFLTSSLHS